MTFYQVVLWYSVSFSVMRIFLDPWQPISVFTRLWVSTLFSKMFKCSQVIEINRFCCRAENVMETAVCGVDLLAPWSICHWLMFSWSYVEELKVVFLWYPKSVSFYLLVAILFDLSPHPCCLSNLPSSPYSQKPPTTSVLSDQNVLWESEGVGDGDRAWRPQCRCLAKA